ncbi:MAG: hypothetical protein Q4B99_02475 [Clostridia bacterium]|nr:hypothetical protein [Clostridia bacterium]
MERIKADPYGERYVQQLDVGVKERVDVCYCEVGVLKEQQRREYNGYCGKENGFCGGSPVKPV